MRRSSSRSGRERRIGNLPACLWRRPKDRIRVVKEKSLLVDIRLQSAAPPGKQRRLDGKPVLGTTAKRLQGLTYVRSMTSVLLLQNRQHPYFVGQKLPRRRQTSMPFISVRCKNPNCESPLPTPYFIAQTTPERIKTVLCACRPLELTCDICGFEAIYYRVDLNAVATAEAALRV